MAKQSFIIVPRYLYKLLFASTIIVVLYNLFIGISFFPPFLSAISTDSNVYTTRDLIYVILLAIDVFYYFSIIYIFHRFSIYLKCNKAVFYISVAIIIYFILDFICKQFCYYTLLSSLHSIISLSENSLINSPIVEIVFKFVQYSYLAKIVLFLVLGFLLTTGYSGRLLIMGKIYLIASAVFLISSILGLLNMWIKIDWINHTWYFFSLSCTIIEAIILLYVFKSIPDKDYDEYEQEYNKDKATHYYIGLSIAIVFFLINGGYGLIGASTKIAFHTIQGKPETVYIRNNTFHYVDTCSELNNCKESKVAYEWAVDEGYKPCPKCTSEN